MTAARQRKIELTKHKAVLRQQLDAIDRNSPSSRGMLLLLQNKINNVKTELKRIN